MMSERRKYQREELTEMVRYIPSPHISDIVYKGLMHDWSCSGLCLIINRVLQEGEEIVFKSDVFPDAKKAVVRWQHSIGKEACKVGLEFVK